MKPILGFTMGDPAGVGPEILIKALARSRAQVYFPVIFGDLECLRYTQSRVLKKHPASGLKFFALPAGPGRFSFSAEGIPVFDLKNWRASGFKYGVATRENGQASGDYIAAAVEWIRNGCLDAIVTAPINKESFHSSSWGKKFPGHTEMLASLSNSQNTALMLTHGLLRAVHVTSHVALRDVSKLITQKKVIAAIKLSHDSVSKLLRRKARIAVCGLNPHAGDGGQFGSEEKKIIAPAVRACRARGINVTGPLPADTVWPKVVGGVFDVGMAMYHDQGQIAVKLQGFRFSKKDTLSGGVNITLGLPFVRTSPAHGTAFDIAGRGMASEKSMLEAIDAAVAMSRGV